MSSANCQEYSDLNRIDILHLFSMSYHHLKGLAHAPNLRQFIQMRHLVRRSATSQRVALLPISLGVLALFLSYLENSMRCKSGTAIALHYKQSMRKYSTVTRT